MSTTTTSRRGTAISVIGVLLAFSLGPPVTSGQSAITRDHQDAALFDWALDRFERAGLELPQLEVEFHDELEPCGGYYGSFTDRTPLHVDICGFNGDRFLPMPKQMILHELGHAWLFANVDDPTIDSFLSFRGLDTWNDPTVDWSKRGFEHAAEVISWALDDSERRVFTITDSHPDVFAAAYQILTSRSAPAR